MFYVGRVIVMSLLVCCVATTGWATEKFTCNKSGRVFSFNAGGF